MAKKKNDFVKCLVVECDQHTSSRGLCIKCYQAASSMIRSGKTSWEELESLGLASKKGRILSMFTDAFRDAKGK